MFPQSVSAVNWPIKKDGKEVIWFFLINELSFISAKSSIEGYIESGRYDVEEGDTVGRTYILKTREENDSFIKTYIYSRSSRWRFEIHDSAEKEDQRKMIRKK